MHDKKQQQTPTVDAAVPVTWHMAKWQSEAERTGGKIGFGEEITPWLKVFASSLMLAYHEGWPW